jgi:Mrp family chromosome partitioning ATPase
LPTPDEPLLREITESETSTLTEPHLQEVATVSTESEIGALASRLMEKRPAEGGHRTLLTGATDEIDAAKETLQLAKALAEGGEQVIVIDWSPDGRGIGQSIGLDISAGLNDLIRGEANFGDIIQRVPASSAHAIACGHAIEAVDSAIDPDQINLMLDALDEAYDYIIVNGRHHEARRLFEIIEGRFDAAVTVAEPRNREAVLQDPPGTFLGFEVAEIDIIRFERSLTEVAPVQQRIARTVQRRPVEMVRPA